MCGGTHKVKTMVMVHATTPTFDGEFGYCKYHTEAQVDKAFSIWWDERVRKTNRKGFQTLKLDPTKHPIIQNMELFTWNDLGSGQQCGHTLCWVDRRNALWKNVMLNGVIVAKRVWGELRVRQYRQIIEGSGIIQYGSFQLELQQDEDEVYDYEDWTE